MAPQGLPHANQGPQAQALTRSERGPALTRRSAPAFQFLRIGVAGYSTLGLGGILLAFAQARARHALVKADASRASLVRAVGTCTLCISALLAAVAGWATFRWAPPEWSLFGLTAALVLVLISVVLGIALLRAGRELAATRKVIVRIDDISRPAS